MWAVPFAVLTAVLVARNWFLFSTKLYEQGDMASNTLRIEEARHFTLLIGDYSRLRFSHPGPAYFYVQGWGEELFYDLLHWTPTGWNAQILAVYGLNSAWVALGVGIVYGWTRSVRGAAAALAVFAAAAVLHPVILSSDWMSFLYVPTYTIFVIAAASVAAAGRRTRGSWRWPLVPDPRARRLPLLRARVHRRGAGGGAVASPPDAAGVDQRLLREPSPGLGAGRGDQRRLPAADRDQPRPALAGRLRQVLQLRVLVGHCAPVPRGGPLRPLVLVADPERALDCRPRLRAGAAVAVAIGLLRFTPPAVRRFGYALLAMNGVSTLAFVCYSFTGVDILGAEGLLHRLLLRSAPIVTAAVIAIGVVEALARAPRRAALNQRTALAVTAATVAVAVAAVAVFAMRPLTRTPTAYTNPYVASFAPTPTRPSRPWSTCSRPAHRGRRSSSSWTTTRGGT